MNIYATSGDIKICREDQPGPTINETWDGKRINVTSPRNATASFAIIIEADEDTLIGGFSVSGLNTRLQAEVFRLGYLQVRGLSRLSYNPLLDERHVPASMQLPIDPEDPRKGVGSWEDRPGADKHFPDPMLPSGKDDAFVVKAGESQMLWVDIRVPSHAKPGDDAFTVTVGDTKIKGTLKVLPLTLAESAMPGAITYLSRTELFRRHLGPDYLYPHDGHEKHIFYLSTTLYEATEKMLREHRVGVFTEHFYSTKEADGYFNYRNNRRLVVGDYGTWANDPLGLEVLLDRWTIWLSLRGLDDVELILYVADEKYTPEDLAEIEAVAARVKKHTGGRVLTMATHTSPVVLWKTCPSLSIACCSIGFSKNPISHENYDELIYQNAPYSRRSWTYNGERPATPTMRLEDDGVAMRLVPLIQALHGHHVHFIWHCNGWQNDKTKENTRVFSEARTFGFSNIDHPSFGIGGDWCGNSDGVLIYPGTDKVHPEESLGLDTPIGSYRLKQWRRGIEDAALWRMAAQSHAGAYEAIRTVVGERVGREVPATNPADPTYSHEVPGWSADPAVWAGFRRALFDILEVK